MWSVGQRIHIGFLENQEFIVVKHMEGGMGDVYKIAEPNFAEFFSIKTLKHSMNAIDFKNECEFSGQVIRLAGDCDRVRLA